MIALYSEYVSNHSNKKFLLSTNEFLFSFTDWMFLDFVPPTFAFHFEHLIVPLLLSKVHCWQGWLVFFLRGFNTCRPETGWYFFIQLQFLKTNNKDCIGCGLQCTICTSSPYKLLWLKWSEMKAVPYSLGHTEWFQNGPCWLSHWLQCQGPMKISNDKQKKKALLWNLHCLGHELISTNNIYHAELIVQVVVFLVQNTRSALLS